MLELQSLLNANGLDRFINRIEAELQASIPLACAELKIIATENIVQMGAVDTTALLQSLYLSTWRYSEYEDACNEAANAYQFNPTKYPDIRKVLGPNLKLDPEAQPESPDEGFMAVAASHGKAIEEGYVSFYGNDVPARPFMAETASQGLPFVVLEFQKGLRRATQ